MPATIAAGEVLLFYVSGDLKLPHPGPAALKASTNGNKEQQERWAKWKLSSPPAFKGLPWWLGDKASAYNVGDSCSIPGSERSPENKMATHSSILAWRIPWAEEPGGLHSPWDCKLNHHHQAFKKLLWETPGNLPGGASPCQCQGQPFVPSAVTSFLPMPSSLLKFELGFTYPNMLDDGYKYLHHIGQITSTSLDLSFILLNVYMAETTRYSEKIASLVAQTVKHLPAMRETWVRFLGQEDPLEKGMAIHSSTLAWKIAWMEEPDRLQSMGSQRVRHDWATSHTHSLTRYSGLPWWLSSKQFPCQWRRCNFDP